MLFYYYDFKTEKFKIRNLQLKLKTGNFMKKIFLTFFALSSLLFINTACNVNFSGSDLLTKPDVEARNSLISISIPLQSSDTSYINVYRTDINDSSKTVVNIGLLFPKAIESTGSAYIFTDELVTTGHTYIYQARYCENGEYYLTDWSNEVKAIGAYDETKSLCYGANSTTFTIDDDFVLTIKGTVQEPDITDFSTEYFPVLLLSTSSKSQAFKLTSVTDGTSLSLRNTIPADFYDTPITVIGITAQKSEYIDPKATDPVTKFIHWAIPTEISIEGTTKKTITIPTIAGTDGYDYSRKLSVKK